MGWDTRALLLYFPLVVFTGCIVASPAGPGTNALLVFPVK